MDIDFLKQSSLEFLRGEFTGYLNNLGLGQNTVSTMSTDAFYLWRKKGKDLFWSVVTSDDFDVTAPSEIEKALSENSTGNVSKLVSPYCSTLKKFRSFVYSDTPLNVVASDEESLRDFLLDIECLDPLSEWTDSFNLFDVLKISRTEIRHSNMLAWLMTPTENHGLGDSILSGFLQFCVSNGAVGQDVFDVLLMDYYDFEIRREWNSIDILAVSQNNRFILCIENKVDSGEHDNQLEKYVKTVDAVFPEYNSVFLFLSPEGMEASDPERWTSMSYQDVLMIIEKARSRHTVLPEVGLLIDNYIETVRRVVVGDDKLARICADIYAKHKRALDLIYENRPDRMSELAEIFRKWAREKTNEGVIRLNPDKSTKSYTRFTTDEMSAVLPEDGIFGGWNCNNHYFFEIVIGTQVRDFWMQFVISSLNMTEEMKLVAERINEISPSKQQKQNWQWRTHLSTRKVKVEEELSEEKIFDQLDKLLKELKTGEAQILEKLN